MPSFCSLLCSENAVITCNSALKNKEKVTVMDIMGIHYIALSDNRILILHKIVVPLSCQDQTHPTRDL